MWPNEGQVLTTKRERTRITITVDEKYLQEMEDVLCLESNIQTNEEEQNKENGADGDETEEENKKNTD